MFDIGWTELLLIAIVAIVVIGPKDLPKAMRLVGQWTARMKRMAREFQGQFNEALKEAELEDVKKDVEQISKSMRDDVNKIDSGVRAEMKKVDAGVRSTASETEKAMTAAPAAAAPAVETAAPVPAAAPVAAANVAKDAT